jgi:hypothetical protein
MFSALTTYAVTRTGSFSIQRPLSLAHEPSGFWSESSFVASSSRQFSFRPSAVGKGRLTGSVLVGIARRDGQAGGAYLVADDRLTAGDEGVQDAGHRGVARKHRAFVREVAPLSQINASRSIQPLQAHHE